MKAPMTYRIGVREELGPEWSVWFDGLEVVATAHGGTTLVGPVRDQAELHGVLARVRDLGLTLLSVEVVRVEEIGTNPGRAADPASDGDRR